MLLAASTPWMTSRTRIFFEIPVFEDCAFLLPGAIPCAVRRQSASETDLNALAAMLTGVGTLLASEVPWIMFLAKARVPSRSWSVIFKAMRRLSVKMLPLDTPSGRGWRDS